MWALTMPVGSPVPIYKPSALPICTRALEARVTQSMGGTSHMGTPQTPMPALGCTGMLASATVCLTKVTARARFQGTDSVETTLTAGPKMSPIGVGPSQVFDI